MSQCSRFSLTEGKQVPLPQRTNDPIISIRILDWCYTPLPFTLAPSVSLSLTYNLSPQSHLDSVYMCPLKHSTVHTKPGRGRRWWWQRRILLEHNKQREVWMKTIRPFLTHGQCFMFIRTVRFLKRGLATWNRLVSKSRQPVGVDVDTFPTGTGLFSRLSYYIRCRLLSYSSSANTGPE